MGSVPPSVHLAEDPLALAHSQLDSVAEPQVFGEPGAVPARRRQTKFLRTPAKIGLQMAPLLRTQRAGTPEPLPLMQGLESALLEPAHPTLYRRVVLAEETCYLPAGVTHRQEEQPMQPMVVAGLLAASDFLLDGYAYRVRTLDL